jgi:hypothetical protein
MTISGWMAVTLRKPTELNPTREGQDAPVTSTYGRLPSRTDTLPTTQPTTDHIYVTPKVRKRSLSVLNDQNALWQKQNSHWFQSVLYCLHSIMYCLQSVLSCLHSVLYCLQSVLYCLHSVLNCLQSVLFCLQSVLNCYKSVL